MGEEIVPLEIIFQNKMISHMLQAHEVRGSSVL